MIPNGLELSRRAGVQDAALERAQYTNEITINRDLDEQVG